LTYFSLDGCSSALSKEIQLEFTRTMNRILFDKTVTAQPGAFPFVTLPEPHAEVIPQTGECILACEALQYYVLFMPQIFY
jgi:hypothetical protein